MSVKLRLTKLVYRILKTIDQVEEHRIFERNGKIVMYRLVYRKGSREVWKKVSLKHSVS